MQNYRTVQISSNIVGIFLSL